MLAANAVGDPVVLEKTAPTLNVSPVPGAVKVAEPDRYTPPSTSVFQDARSRLPPLTVRLP